MDERVKGMEEALYKMSVWRDKIEKEIDSDLVRKLERLQKQLNKIDSATISLIERVSRENGTVNKLLDFHDEAL